MSLKDIQIAPGDIRGMRMALDQYSRGGSWSRGVISTIAPLLVRTAEDVAYHRGLNGEDKYTLLAYNALLELEKRDELLLKFSASCLDPIVYLGRAGELNAKPKA